MNELLSTKPRAWTVSALCRAVADSLDAQFNPVSVRGEISGFSRAASGHCYFSIKDETGQIRCAMFKGRNQTVSFKPINGQQVLVKGAISVYEPRGDYQLLIESMLPAGDGLLAQQFDALKMKLAAEEATKTVETTMQTAQAGSVEFGLKAIEAMRTNAEMSLAHMEALLGVKSVAELVELQTAFIRKQAEVTIEQAKAIQETAKKVADTMTKPGKEAAEKVMSSLKVA